jgi:hypothetical protein
MTERAHELAATAQVQIGELIELLGTLDQAALDRLCPGREKLGDGTIGAAARHTADNYQRIAAFAQTNDRVTAAHQPAAHGGIASQDCCAPSATDPETTPGGATTPASTTAATPQTTSTSTPSSRSWAPRATPLAGSPS